MSNYGSPEMHAELTRDEGLRLKPYTDTVGKLSIGVGRNLTDVGISVSESEVFLGNDIARSERDLDRNVPWWRAMSPVRQRGLLNMCFNMGWGNGSNGLSSFKNSLALLQAGKYAEAAINILKSKWATQVGARAVRIAAQFRQG